MDCSLPGSSVHGDSPGNNTGVSCHFLLQGIFPTQGSNLGLPHCRWILYPLSHQESPMMLLCKYKYKNILFWFKERGKANVAKYWIEEEDIMVPVVFLVSSNALKCFHNNNKKNWQESLPRLWLPISISWSALNLFNLTLIYLDSQNRQVLDFPGGPVVAHLPANEGDTDLIPGLARPHRLQSDYAPQLMSPQVATTEVHMPRACAPQQEKPLQWEAARAHN